MLLNHKLAIDQKDMKRKRKSCIYKYDDDMYKLCNCVQYMM